MNRIPLARLPQHRPSLLARLLRQRLILLGVGGWLLWTCAPADLLEQARSWATDVGLDAWGESDGLSDEELTGAWRPTDREIDQGSLEFFEPVIDLLFGGEATSRDGRLRLERSERYMERLEEIDET